MKTTEEIDRIMRGIETDGLIDRITLTDANANTAVFTRENDRWYIGTGAKYFDHGPVFFGGIRKAMERGDAIDIHSQFATFFTVA